MAKTDGYITDSQGGDWKTSNTGGSGRGDVTDVEGNAYIRTSDGPQPGVKVLVDGSVSSGPSIDFADANGLLSGAGAADGERPFIVWAGVSPMSLSEGLIVWNQPIVLLDKSKISFDTVTVVGRLMVVKFSGPVSIDGSDSEQCTIQAGAVGYYKDSQENQCPAPAGGDAQANPGQGEQGNTPADQPAAQPDQSIFCDMCNPDAQCGNFEGSKAGFVVNNDLGPFDLKCTHTFSLTPCKTCGGQADAKVWMVAMDIFASTMPLEVYSIDALIEYDTDAVGSYSYEDATFPAVLAQDTDCCPDSPPSALIIGTAGPPVEVSAEWNGDMPGFEGQPCKYIVNPCGTYCSAPADELQPDDVDCIVGEDIIKPVQRSCPVSFFEPWVVTTTVLTLPTTTYTVELSHVVECVRGEVVLLTDIVTEVVTFPTAVFTGQLSLPGYAQLTTVEIPVPYTGTQVVVTTCVEASASLIDQLFHDDLDVVTAGRTVEVDVLTGLDTGPAIQPLTSIEPLLTNLSVVTACSGQLGPFELVKDPAEAWVYLVYADAYPDYFEYFTYLDLQGQFEAGDVITLITECAAGDIVVTSPAAPVRITYVDGPVAEFYVPNLNEQVINLVNQADVAVLTVPEAPPGGGDLVTFVDKITRAHIVGLGKDTVDVLTGTGYRAWPGDGDLFDTVDVITDLGEAYTLIHALEVTGGNAVKNVEFDTCEPVTAVEVVSGGVTIPGGGAANLTWYQTNIIVCDNGDEATVPVITYITDLGGGGGGDAVTITVVTGVNIYKGECQLVRTFEQIPFAEIEVLKTVTPAVEPVVHDIINVEAIPFGLLTQVTGEVYQTFTAVNDVLGQPINLATITIATAVAQTVVTLPVQIGSELVYVFDGAPARPQINVVTGTVQHTYQVVTTCYGEEFHVGVNSAIGRLDIGGQGSDRVMVGWAEQVVENIVETCLTGTLPVCTDIQAAAAPAFAPVNNGLEGRLTYIEELWDENLQYVASGNTATISFVRSCVYGELAVVTDVTPVTLTLASPTTGTIVTFVTAVLNGEVSMIKDFDLATVTVVTSCVSDVLTLTLPDAYEPFTLITPADEGFTLITETEPTCDASYKFLNHPGVLQWTNAEQTTEDCCDTDPPYTCTPVVEDHPDEENCEWFLTLVANYVKNEGLGNAEECPCYDCTSEPDCAEGNNDIQDIGNSAPTPCVARFRRMNRRFCKQCRPQ